MPVWYPGFGRSLGGGHDNSLQYSCLVNSRDRRAWRATVHRVTQSRTWQKRLSKYVCMICTYLLKQKWLLNSFTNTLNSPFVLGIICILFLIVDCTPQHVGPYRTRDWATSLALTGGLLTTGPQGKSHKWLWYVFEVTLGKEPGLRTVP